MQNRFGVRLGLECVAATNERFAQSAVIIDLSIVDDAAGAVLIVDRLMASRAVDNRQAAVSQSTIVLEMVPRVIRASMPQGRVHPLQSVLFYAPVPIPINDSTDAAHSW